ncbi:MAG: PepSY domain-containing protein [Pyrinomonadaceae bacterium]
MKAIKTMIWLFVVALGLGISVLSLPQTTNAQTDKDKKEKKQEREDDDKDDDEKLSSRDKKKAKITLEEARAIALRRVAGTVVEEELEKEKGRLQYAFDIRDSSGKIWDVEIDAITGEVLQAAEDDEDGDNERNSLNKAKNSVYRAAIVVKNVTTRAVGKLF